MLDVQIQIQFKYRIGNKNCELIIYKLQIYIHIYIDILDLMTIYKFIITHKKLLKNIKLSYILKLLKYINCNTIF